MNESDRIYVAGHAGLVGSAIVRGLRKAGFNNLLVRSRAELDLRRQADVEAFFAVEKPAYVFLAAARVGGILANDSFPADFIRDNLQIQTNVIDAAWRSGVKKLQFLGSSCIYPKHAPQPMREESLLTGPLEPTNQWYAVAKIAGLKMCQAYRRQHGFNAISLTPTNLYGPGDNFSPEGSHVLPGLMQRCHTAKEMDDREVTVWGSGTALREFLHADDLADAAVFLMQRYEGQEPVNVGTGQEVSIRELAEMVRETVEFRGALKFDTSKPDGTPRKLVDISRITAMGWTPSIELRQGIADTYAWYLRHRTSVRTD